MNLAERKARILCGQHLIAPADPPTGGGAVTKNRSDGGGKALDAEKGDLGGKIAKKSLTVNRLYPLP